MTFFLRFQSLIGLNCNHPTVSRFSVCLSELTVNLIDNYSFGFIFVQLVAYEVEKISRVVMDSLLVSSN